MSAEQLLSLARKRGAEVIERANGHFQIKGALLVNYYPNSKRKCAYIAGTVGGKIHVTPQEAVEMAFTAPKIAAPNHKDKRSNNSRRKRAKLLKFRTFCHWCHCSLTLDTSTLEHIIPLDRGGLDNANNRTLACEPCNTKRGNNMPELK